MLAGWTSILERGTWEVLGKGEKVDVFDLASALIREFRIYQHWQLAEAQRNEAMRDALADQERAYVLLTRNGRRTAPGTIYKILNWHAVRNGVGLKTANGRWDVREGLDSRVTPHALRRAWATIALNDEEQPIDVVSEVLRHSDISTTRRHYAPTKSDRARNALRTMKV